MLKEKILRTIRKHNLLSDGDNVVIGFSGGPDSLTLLINLIEISKNDLNIRLYPVHVNHLLRGEASKDDSEFCAYFAKKNDLECRIFERNCEETARALNVSTEEAGRYIRYDCFAKVAKEIEASGISKSKIKIAVAQNADDRAETLLFRIIRGTGTDGLASINYSRTDDRGFDIVRPILNIYRNEIEEFLSEQPVKPSLDKTNFEPLYSRNRIRLELIPLLEKNYNPNIKKTINRLAEIAEDDRSFFDSKSNELLKTATEKAIGKSILMDIQILRGSESPIRRRTIVKAFKKIGLSEDMTYAHIEACEKILMSDSPSADVNLPYGYRFRRIYDKAEAMRGGNNVAEKQQKSKKTLKVRIMPHEDFEGINPVDKLEGSFVALDYENLCKITERKKPEEFLTLRKRQEGDYILIKSGRKKIQNLLVDEKIPRVERDLVSLVAIGMNVIWAYLEGKINRQIEGCEISEETKNVIIIEIVSAT